MNLHVHHLNRARSHRILWLLEEFGADYDITYYMRDETTNLAPPELANVHPLGKAPMQEIDGRLVVEMQGRPAYQRALVRGKAPD